MFFDALSGKDKLRLIQFFDDFHALVEKSKLEAKPFSEVTDEDIDDYLLYDEKKLRQWNLTDDKVENLRKYAIVSSYFSAPEHSCDITGYEDDEDSTFSGWAINIVFDDSGYEEETANNRNWYIEIVPKDDTKGTHIIIDNGDYYYDG